MNQISVKTMNGSDPTISAEALDSDDIALILSFIAARFLSTSARFDKVSVKWLGKPLDPKDLVD